MNNMEKLLLIILFFAASYYPLCGVIGLIRYIRGEELRAAESEDNKYGVKVVTRGNCMMCGKELIEGEGIFFCKECSARMESEEV